MSTYVQQSPTLVHAPTYRGLVGTARRDVTPPVGVHLKNWGASTGDVATGIHEPLRCSAVALAADATSPPLLLVALDHGWWRSVEDEAFYRGALIDEFGLPAERVVLSLSHTHAAPTLSILDAEKPGGELLIEHRGKVREQILGACHDALDGLRPAVLDWGVGESDVAVERDLRVGGEELCGFNPAAPADGTVTVGRVSDPSGAVRAVLVNYACHPTIMAWRNSSVSADFVGSLRSAVETRLGAECIFLQGASGDLGCRDQHTSSPAAVDLTGRRLAAAVDAVLLGMLPPSTALELAGAVDSGARVAFWREVPATPNPSLSAVIGQVELPLRELPSLDALDAQWQDLPDHVRAERLARARQKRRAIGAGRTMTFEYSVWMIGDQLLVAQPAESYSWIAQELRRRFGSVAFLNLSNGFSFGYLPTADRYDRPDVYQVSQSLFEQGTLEILCDAVTDTIRECQDRPQHASVPQGRAHDDH